MREALRVSIDVERDVLSLVGVGGQAVCLDQCVGAKGFDIEAPRVVAGLGSRDVVDAVGRGDDPDGGVDELGIDEGAVGSDPDVTPTRWSRGLRARSGTTHRRRRRAHS